MKYKLMKDEVKNLKVEANTLEKSFTKKIDLNCSCRKLLAKINRTKAMGLYITAIDTIIALKKVGIYNLTEIINTQQWQHNEDMSRSIIVPLPKNPGTNECELRWTAKRMSLRKQLIIRLSLSRA